MIQIAARWLRQEHPYELEFEGLSEGSLCTHMGASSDSNTPKRYHSPKELVALGIAGCTGVDVVSILKKMRQPLEDLSVEAGLTQTTEHPRVFDTCQLTYRLKGQGLETDRVLRAVALSYAKYCGVSAMIKRSGCRFDPHVILNEIDITDQFLSTIHEIESSENLTVTAKARAKAALLITGNEVLSGKTQDTNGRFLARNLAEWGFILSESRLVGDDRRQLSKTLGDLFESNDVVFMTGGLGPTKDDLTSEVASEFFHAPLVFSDEAWTICRTAFEKLGKKEIPDSNKKQAMLPEGAVVLKNRLGTAAGFMVSKLINGDLKTLVALPGVPWECESMFDEEVRPRLPKTHSGQREWGPWTIWGVGESAIQTLIKNVEQAVLQKIPQAEFSFQAHAGYVTYLIRAQAENADESFAALADIDLKDELDQLERLLGDRVLFTGRQTLLQRLLEGAKELEISLGVAESCTGGRIAAELTSLSGISEVFRGGVTAYSNEVKMRLLSVRESTLNSCGAVSSEVAIEMARGAAQTLDANIGLSVTGVAGPSGGSETKPVGMVCLALSVRGFLNSINPQKARFTREFLEQKLGPLKTQGWAEAQNDGEELVLVVEKRFGSHLTRDVIQKRATLFGLCTLVALIEALRGD